MRRICSKYDHCLNRQIPTRAEEKSERGLAGNEHSGEPPCPDRDFTASVCELSLCESRSCSVLTVCSAPVVREKVSARVLLLRVGLATLRLLLYTYVCTA